MLGQRHPDVGISEANLAIALTELGRDKEDASSHVDKAIAIASEGLGAGHPSLALHLNNRGEILRPLGRHGEARAAFERSTRDLGARAWVRQRVLAYALTGIGETYLAEGDANSALVPLERALKIRPVARSRSSHDAPKRTSRSRERYGIRSRDRGRARALAEEARASYAKTPAKDKLAEVESLAAPYRHKNIGRRQRAGAPLKTPRTADRRRRPASAERTSSAPVVIATTESCVPRLDAGLDLETDPVVIAGQLGVNPPAFTLAFTLMPVFFVVVFMVVSLSVFSDAFLSAPRAMSRRDVRNF